MEKSTVVEIKKVSEIRTFGDARRLVLQTIIDIRDENISVQQGMAIAACMKVVNDNIQAEINAAKCSMNADRVGAQFGRIRHMGTRLISENTDEEDDCAELFGRAV